MMRQDDIPARTSMKGISPQGFPESYRGALVFMFNHGGPRLLLFLMLASLAYRWRVGNFLPWDGVVVFLFIGLRSFMEWGLHVYVFNASPLPGVGWRLRSPISTMHGVHHENPFSHEALFFGWKGVAAVVTLSLAVLSLVFRNEGLVASGVFAITINLMLYEWFHLLAHANILPEFKPFLAAVSNHRSHHFLDGSRSMGVSSVLADKLLGTYNEPRLGK